MHFATSRSAPEVDFGWMGPAAVKPSAGTPANRLVLGQVHRSSSVSGVPRGPRSVLSSGHLTRLEQLDLE